MKTKFNILVTGCGGDIGQSIGKILKQSSYVNQFFGCDISDKNAGKFIFENFFVSERCTSPNYLSFVENVINEKNIDIVIPIAEPELRFYAEKGIVDKIGSAKLLTASLEAIEVGFDKLKTANFLEAENLPFPLTQNLSAVKQPEQFPVILKSKTGSGSSTVHVVKSQDDFEYLKGKNPDFIVQEYLSDSQGEYTCGAFRSRSGTIRLIAFKRELTGGYSGYGEVVEDESITKVLTSIVNGLALVGSINIQLRLTSKGPVVFEINPRFSSTVLFRHLFGFKDVEWSIQDLMGIPLANYTEQNNGRKFYKGFNEYIL
jgi:carbamoyl-phosphate synthase large subunit